MHLVILVPVLRRPHRVVPLLDSIEAATPEPHRVLFICDPDDEPEKAAVDNAHGGQRIEVAGNYAKKINVGADVTSEPLLFLGADDLDFHPGWFEAASSRLEGRVAVVGTNDLGNPRVMAGKTATHSLVTRAYVEAYGTVDERGKVLHEGYQHNFCDSEFVETAKRRRAWAFASDSTVEHLHPHWSKGEDDEVYRKGQAGFEVDRQLFHRRERLIRRVTP